MELGYIGSSYGILLEEEMASYSHVYSKLHLVKDFVFFEGDGPTSVDTPTLFPKLVFQQIYFRNRILSWCSSYQLFFTVIHPNGTAKIMAY